MSDLERRFGGVARLYGEEGAARLRAAHIAVVGIGGVGSWVAEALARTGVGRLTLIDLDMVAESNTNRQIHALGDEYGKAKVTAMAERIRAINPACVVQEVEDFVTPDNLEALLGQGFDAVIDAIDQVHVKVAMLAWCKAQKLPVITVGAAGGQLDPTRIRIADLTATQQDPLLAKVRSRLRKEHGFPRGGKAKFGIPAVYSDEPLRYPTQACSTTDTDGNDSSESGAEAARGPQGLNCAGFGSSVCVTASFGLAAAAYMLGKLAET
jgi:tRNA A37 threonylcarbamoyladenosine dehydratase